MNIAVLAGGFSPEREVSLLSGALIANSLCKSGHRVVLLDAFFPYTGEISLDAFTDKGGFSHAIPPVPPDLSALRMKVAGTALIGEGVLALCALADTVFLAMHGGMGENGMLQAVLSSMGIPYTGSGFEGCHSAMDKAISKLIFRAEGIPTADFTLYKTGDPLPKIPFPAVVKPCSCGSSVGVRIVRDETELSLAVSEAEKYENRLLLEDYIAGREFSVGVLLGRALPAVEIRPKGGFYDYERKYQNGMTKEICPAPLPKDEAERLGTLALRVHEALSLGSYSRIDFIKEEKTGRFMALEANTLPGMTPVSLLPQEAAAAGISYDELCEAIVRASVR